MASKVDTLALQLYKQFCANNHKRFKEVEFLEVAEDWRSRARARLGLGTPEPGSSNQRETLPD